MNGGCRDEIRKPWKSPEIQGFFYTVNSIIAVVGGTRLGRKLVNSAQKSQKSTGGNIVFTVFD